MALIIDSTAQFRSRADEVGMTTATRDVFIAAGLNTMSKFAFWINQPGTAADDAAITGATTALLGGPPTVGDLAAVKRLHFESQAFTLQALKNSIDGPGADAMQPKKIPLAEKESRMKAIGTRLTGISLEGPLEPSTSLLEQTVHQHETKTIKYLPPEKCYSREHEIKFAKPAKSLQVEGGTIAFKENTTIPGETIFTSLQFQQALTRRAVAYDFAELLSFDVSRRYCDMLLKHLMREAPPGYSPTTLAQLVKADQQVWAKMSEAGSDIRRNAAGDLPLDALIIRCLESYEISFYLLPMVTPTTNSAAYYDRSAPYEDHQQKGKKGKGKGKRKSKGEHVQTWVPPKLRGGKPTNPAGHPICFNYNLDGCDAAQPGSACPRGLHVCCKCFKNHAFTGNHEVEGKPGKP